MTTFDLEMEALPVWPNGHEIVEAADALTQTAADLLEEIVPDGTAEYAPEATIPGAADLLEEAVAGDTAEYASETSAPGSAESQGQDIPTPVTATVADDVPQLASIEAAATCSEVQSSEPEAGDTAAALRARRKADGARGHYTGEGVAAYVGHNIGARSIKPHSNHHDLGGVHFQIRTINGKQNTCTGASRTDPSKIIVAAKKRDGGLQGSSRYMLYGVLRADALMVAKKSRSRGHVNSGHYLFSLSQVQKVELGSLFIPDDLVVADTSEQRTQRLARISTLETNLDNPTVKAARAFLAAEPVSTVEVVVESAPDASTAEPMDLITSEPCHD